MRMLHRRNAVYALIYGLVSGILISIGYQAASFGELRPFKIIPVIIFAATAFFGMAAFYAYSVYLEKHTVRNITMRRLPYAVTSVCILICWIPVFLAEFPGFFVYDAVDEYIEVATRQFSTHHPLLHTLILGGCVRAGEVFLGGANAGIAVYILIQMVVLSLIFAWVIHTMERGYVFALLWYALFPTVVMYALCSVKDTVFAAALLVSVVLTYRILRDTDPAGKMSADAGFLGAALLIMMLTRHNGVYAYIIYAVVMVFVLGKLKLPVSRKLMNVSGFIAVLVLYLIINACLVHVTRADDSEHQEILTVPIQQLARTWNAYHDEMSEEELETLYEILPEEVLKHYTPSLADPVKTDFVNAAYEQDPSRYRHLWWELFKKHPLCYINAWIGTSYGYYYPFTVVNVYEGHEVFTFTYDESSYFGYEVEYPGERHSLIPSIDRFYRWLSLDDDIQRIPVLSLPFSMGTMFLVYLFGIMVFVFRKDHAALCAFILPAAVYMTLWLGPTFLPRYAVFLWFLFPFFIYSVFMQDSDKKGLEES